MKTLDEIRKKGGVEIMKASAGSGKTFSLAREYIRVLLSDNKQNGRNAHRHILAVTFTNKATEEMKSRIVEQLHLLAMNPSKSDYCKDLLAQCGFASEGELQEASAVALKDLLNDYGAFSVSTIDKFFQRTLRAFSRELGQSSEYRVDLDRPSLVSEATDRFWDSLSPDGGNAEGLALSSKDMLNWLVECVTSDMDSGEGLSIEKRVKEFASGYLSESYEKKIKDLQINEAKAFSEENIKKLKKICNQVIKDYKAGIEPLVDDLNSVVSKYDEDELAPHFFNAVQALAKHNWDSKDLPKCFGQQTLRKAADNPESAFTAKFLKKLPRPQADIDRIGDLCTQIMDYAGEKAKIRKTAFILRGQAGVFRVAANLRKNFNELLKEKNVLGLEDTNNILKDIIDGSDAPFIYEKTGTRYNHFLLDEFQDTSSVQWECFRPLLQNSVAEGQYNLVVGDVKQRIYRWRNAVWDILDKEVEADVSPTLVNPLDTNWRSAGKVVRFNNAFHAFVAGELDKEAVKEEIQEAAPEAAAGSTDPSTEKGRIAEIYKDVVQEVGKKKADDDGHVRLVFSEEWDQPLVKAIQDAVGQRGYRYKDIAVLVKTNKLGGDVAAKLAEAGIPIITNDSLKIAGSACVREVVSCLYKIDNPEDKVHSLGVSPDFADKVADSIDNARSLCELADALFRRQDQKKLNEDALYVLAFMDLIRDFVAINGNSLHAFLEYWEEMGLDKNIASPKDSDAVTIITIHKSKGLAYPYVIIPLPKKENVMKSDAKNWYAPSKEVPFDGCESALYNVTLSKDSLFKESYEKEYGLCQVDFINTWYVAMTRAVSEMLIIGGKAAKSTKLLKAFVDTGEIEFAKGTLTVQDAEGTDTEVECYDYGVAQNFPPAWKSDEDSKSKKEPKKVGVLTLQYSPEEIPGSHSAGTVRISNEASDYFHGEGEDSARRRGIVLHSIMQGLQDADGVHDAVRAAVDEGSLRGSDAVEVEDILSSAMAKEASRGWFGSGNTVLDETSIITADEVFRPDRVVIFPDRVDIIDYKFGEEHKKYYQQVGKYMDLYSRMGYKNVHGYLWFVADGRVVELDRFCE